jgi:hypothetical protein
LALKEKDVVERSLTEKGIQRRATSWQQHFTVMEAKGDNWF